MKKAIKAIAVLLVAAALAVGGVFVCRKVVPKAKSMVAYAEERQEVLADLQADNSFDIADFPTVANDYSLRVIQIAESKDGKLCVYVYQPSGKSEVTATSVNISQAINDSLKYENFTLRCMSRAGTLHKYEIEGLTVKADAVRYYDISNIFRAWNETLGDAKPTDDNKVSEVPYGVGQLWTACTADGNVTYHMTETETIVVTEKHVGFVRYLNKSVGIVIGSWQIKEASSDNHYVAFSTDRNMERLYEADVTYCWESQQRLLNGDVRKVYDSGTSTVTVRYDKEETVDGGWFGNKKYTWKEIQSVQDFENANELTDETKAALQNKQWVLRFAVTSYRQYSEGTAGMSSGRIDMTEVSDVTILRLKFETDGTVYNLGVVDNKQSGDSEPDGIQTPPKTWRDKVLDFFKAAWRFTKRNWMWILLAAGIVFVVGLFVRILRWIAGK